MYYNICMEDKNLYVPGTIYVKHDENLKLDELSEANIASSGALTMAAFEKSIIKQIKKINIDAYNKRLE